MRKILYSMFIIMILFICSMSLVSCEAITAQNITNTDAAPGMNGGQRMNGGGQRINGGPGRDGNSGKNVNTNDN